MNQEQFLLFLAAISLSAFAVVFNLNSLRSTALRLFSMILIMVGLAISLTILIVQFFIYIG